MRTHLYKVDLNWTGNLGTGTSGYKNYERCYDLSSMDKPILTGSADAAFRGDATKYNPEEFLLMALSSCHMLWYLHLCANAGVVVTAYSDNATAIMDINDDGSGKFSSATLHPKIIIDDESYMETAYGLHKDANRYSFIANSCNFTINHKPEIFIKGKP